MENDTPQHPKDDYSYLEQKTSLKLKNKLKKTFKNSPSVFVIPNCKVSSQ